MEPNFCRRDGCACDDSFECGKGRTLIDCIKDDMLEAASFAVQSEMAERQSKRMYFVREPSQAQSSDKLDAEIASLIEKATKQREQLDKLDSAFNEARVCPGRLGKILERCCILA